MFLNNYHFYQIMTRIIPIEPSIPGEPKAPDNTQRAKSARQYLEAKSARQYPESQKRQTIPGEPITFFFFQNCFENKKTGKYYSVYIKMFLNNYHFYQIMTRIIPIEPSIPGEPKAPDNGEPKAPDMYRRAKSARQLLFFSFENEKEARAKRPARSIAPESQKRQTIPGEPITFFFFSKLLFKIKKRQVLLSLHKNVLEQLPFLLNNDQNNTH